MSVFFYFFGRYLAITTGMASRSANPSNNHACRREGSVDFRFIGVLLYFSTSTVCPSTNSAIYACKRGKPSIDSDILALS